MKHILLALAVISSCTSAFADKEAAAAVAIVGPQKFRDLVLILDPQGSELKEGRAGALTFELARGIFEKSTPIIVSGSIVRLFLERQSAQADSALYAALNMEIFLERQDRRADFIKRLEKKYPLLALSKLSIQDAYPLLPFNTHDFHIFIHDQADLVLLVPKDYLKNYFSHEKSQKKQILEAGFAVGEDEFGFVEWQGATGSDLLQKIVTVQESPFGPMQALGKCLIGNRNNDPYQWNVYLTGHGKSSWTRADLERTLAEIRKERKAIEEKIAKGEASFGVQFALKVAQQQESLATKQLKSVESVTPNTVVSGDAGIAGLKGSEFIELIKILEKIGTVYLHNSTCFSGGYNQAFLQQILKKVNCSFLISSAGLTDMTLIVTAAVNIAFDAQSHYKLTFERYFGDFFKKLRTFFGDPRYYIEQYQKQAASERIKDPIQRILSSILTFYDLSNQCFLRVPRVGIFTPISYSDDVQILTSAQEAAASFENRTIEIEAKRAFEVLVSKVNVPIKFKYPWCQIVALARSIAVVGGTMVGEPYLVMLFKDIEIPNNFAGFVNNIFTLNRNNRCLFLIETLTCSWNGKKEICKDCMLMGELDRNGLFYMRGSFVRHDKGYQITVQDDHVPDEGFLMQAVSQATFAEQTVKEASDAFKKAADGVGHFKVNVGSLGEILKKRETKLKEMPTERKKSVDALVVEIAQAEKAASAQEQSARYQGIIQRIDRMYEAGFLDDEGYQRVFNLLPKLMQEKAKQVRTAAEQKRPEVVWKAKAK